MCPRNARYNEIRNIPQRTGTGETGVKVAPVKKESSGKGVAVSGSELPAVATSKIDVNAKPMYEPAGKPITQVNIDEDLPENDKPWRRPGTDISDYFNYGFDEFTWALYASKQDNLRSEFDQDKIAQNQKKMFEEMNMMMAMGGMPGMPGMPTGAAGAGGGMSIPGMEGVPPEMQAMMQQCLLPCLVDKLHRELVLDRLETRTKHLDNKVLAKVSSKWGLVMIREWRTLGTEAILGAGAVVATGGKRHMNRRASMAHGCICKASGVRYKSTVNGLSANLLLFPTICDCYN